MYHCQVCHMQFIRKHLLISHMKKHRTEDMVGIFPGNDRVTRSKIVSLSNGENEDKFVANITKSSLRSSTGSVNDLDCDSEPSSTSNDNYSPCNRKTKNKKLIIEPNIENALKDLIKENNGSLKKVKVEMSPNNEVFDKIKIEQLTPIKIKTEACNCCAIVKIRKCFSTKIESIDYIPTDNIKEELNTSDETLKIENSPINDLKTEPLERPVNKFDDENKSELVKCEFDDKIPQNLNLPMDLSEQQKISQLEDDRKLETIKILENKPDIVYLQLNTESLENFSEVRLLKETKQNDFDEKIKISNESEESIQLHDEPLENSLNENQNFFESKIDEKLKLDKSDELDESNSKLDESVQSKSYDNVQKEEEPTDKKINVQIQNNSSENKTNKVIILQLLNKVRETKAEDIENSSDVSFECDSEDILHLDTSDVSLESGLSELDSSDSESGENQKDNDEETAPSRIMVEEHDAETAPSPIVVEEHDAETAPSRIMVKEHDAETAPSRIMVEEHDAETAPSCIMVEEHDAETALSRIMVEEHDVETAPSCITVEEHDAETAPTCIRVEEHDAETAPSCIMVEEHDAETAPTCIRVEEHDAETALSHILVEEHDAETAPSFIMVEEHDAETAPSHIIVEEHNAETAPFRIMIEEHYTEIAPSCITVEAHDAETAPSSMMAEEHDAGTAPSRFMVEAGVHTYSELTKSAKALATPYIEIENASNTISENSDLQNKLELEKMQSPMSFKNVAPIDIIVDRNNGENATKKNVAIQRYDENLINLPKVVVEKNEITCEISNEVMPTPVFNYSDELNVLNRLEESTKEIEIFKTEKLSYPQLIEKSSEIDAFDDLSIEENTSNALVIDETFDENTKTVQMDAAFFQDNLKKRNRSNDEISLNSDGEGDETDKDCCDINEDALLNSSFSTLSSQESPDKVFVNILTVKNCVDSNNTINRLNTDEQQPAKKMKFSNKENVDDENTYMDSNIQLLYNEISKDKLSSTVPNKIFHEEVPRTVLSPIKRLNWQSFKHFNCKRRNGRRIFKCSETQTDHGKCNYCDNPVSTQMCLQHFKEFQHEIFACIYCCKYSSTADASREHMWEHLNKDTLDTIIDLEASTPSKTNMHDIMRDAYLAGKKVAGCINCDLDVEFYKFFLSYDLTTNKL